MTLASSADRKAASVSRFCVQYGHCLSCSMVVPCGNVACSATTSQKPSNCQNASRAWPYSETSLPAAFWTRLQASSSLDDQTTLASAEVGPACSVTNPCPPASSAASLTT